MRFTYSLYTALGLSVTGTVALVMTVHAYIAYQNQREEISLSNWQAVSDVAQTLSANSAGFIEAYAPNEYAKLVVTEMDQSAIKAIVVEDYNLGALQGERAYVTGKIRDQDWNVIDFDPYNKAHADSIANCFHHKTEPVLSSLDQVIGSVYVCGSGRSVAQVLHKTVIDTAIDTVLISLILTVLLILTASKFVLQPISQIVDAVSKRDETGLPSQSIPQSGSIELKALKQALDHMIEAVQVSRTHLQKEHDVSVKNARKLRQMIDSTSEGYWSLDVQNLHILEVNSALATMLGYLPAEMHGKVSSDFCDAENAEILKCNAAKLGLSDHRRYEVSLQHKDGHNVPVFFNASTFRDHEGKAMFSYAFVTDLSEQKQIQVALQEARNEAVRANNAKSEFLASMSHELRTPLNAILGFSQLMQYDPGNPLNEKQAEHVEAIISGGHHLLSLVNDILDLAKIEANQAALSLEDVDANEVVAECVALTTPLGQADAIRIADEFSTGEPVRIKTDRQRFKQIVLNLLSNAVKYNRSSGHVKISGHKTDAGFLHLCISDTGYGIAEEDRSSVFKMFQRLHDDPTIAREGTGIGLTVTKLLIERLAGRIDFESETDVGTTFWIELPLASNDEVIIWADNLRIGIDVIDEDHKTITGLINKIALYTLDDPELDELLDEVVHYSNRHFRREELVMQVCGYPELDEHRVSHQKIRQEMERNIKVWKGNRQFRNLVNLQHFLKDFWMRHVYQDDAKIAFYAKGKMSIIEEALARNRLL